VEEIGGKPMVSYIQAAPAPAPVAPAPAAVPAPAAPAPKPAPATKKAEPVDDTPTDGTALKAPMPGMIVRYEKNVGDSVTKGETVVVLEAMKMENALPSPVDGIIQAIHFKSSDSVAKGAVLCVIG
jgi:oxaloacetate decarboxylase alpha subunit/pyruvate carboxylase subunit B